MRQHWVGQPTNKNWGKVAEGNDSVSSSYNRTSGLGDFSKEEGRSINPDDIFNHLAEVGEDLTP